MRSPEELRAEARRLCQTINRITDPTLKQELAGRALELSERAEAIAKTPEDPEIIRANIEHYRRIFGAGINDDTRIVEELLRDAETILARVAGDR
jgi:hypothetical protein